MNLMPWLPNWNRRPKGADGSECAVEWTVIPLRVGALKHCCQVPGGTIRRIETFRDAQLDEGQEASASMSPAGR